MQTTCRSVPVLFYHLTNISMKRICSIAVITLLVVAMYPSPAFSQQSVTEKKLLGTWKMVIDVEEALDEASEEEDDLFAKIIIQGVSGLVEGIIENIDIYFEFKPEGELTIYVNAFNEDEQEDGSWYINKRGELIIESSDNVRINMDNNDYWMFDGDLLVSMENGQIDDNVYLVRME